MPPHGWLVPQWTAPGVGALMTTRQGGVSTAPFDSLNLRAAVGDEPHAVKQNLALLEQAMATARPVFLKQVHGARVVRLSASDAERGAELYEADASVTTDAGVACAVQVADCLPVLFAAPRGRAVAAAHAGWRGLALGVVEATLQSVCDAAGCAPGEVQAWLGACIGPHHFEVGSDVLQAFGVSPQRAQASRFRPCAPGKWLADLPSLARDRLHAGGVRDITGGQWCTVEEAKRFFSFRRDRITGRMVAAVWIEQRETA